VAVGVVKTRQQCFSFAIDESGPGPVKSFRKSLEPAKRILSPFYRDKISTGLTGIDGDDIGIFEYQVGSRHQHPLDDLFKYKVYSRPTIPTTQLLYKIQYS